MTSTQISHFSILVAIFLVSIDCCFCMNVINGSLAGGQAVASWYGNREGFGSDGGACGYEGDVATPPWSGYISAGNNALYNGGKGCGACYQVKCTQDPLCSGIPVTVPITDQCPGCTDAPFRFDLSGKAFGALAKRGQEDALRNKGKINIDFQRVPCQYSQGITIKTDRGSNPFYLAFVTQYIKGDGDIGYVEISGPNLRGSVALQQSFGASWKVNLPNGPKGPFSVKIITTESKQTVFLPNIIPANWAPGQRYHQ